MEKWSQIFGADNKSPSGTPKASKTVALITGTGMHVAVTQTIHSH